MWSARTGRVYEQTSGRTLGAPSQITTIRGATGPVAFGRPGTGTDALDVLFVYREDSAVVTAYRRSTSGTYSQSSSLFPLPDNTLPIGLTFGDATDTLYILDASWRCFAYDVTLRADPVRYTFAFNESRSFNYHRSATETH